MLRKCLSHIRSQWMGALALFLVLTTGSAYALAGSNTVFSDDIVNGQVTDKDVGDNAIRAAELADGSVNSRELVNGGVKGIDLRNNGVGSVDLRDNGTWSADVRDDTLPNGGLSAADLQAGSVGGSEVTDSSLGGDDVGDNSLGGDDISEGTLSRVPSAAIGGIGDWSTPAGCQPESKNYVDCGFNRVNLPEPTNVLVIATVRGIGDPGTSGGTGFCRLASNKGGSVPSSASFQSNGDNTTLLAVIPTGTAGVEDYGVECNEYTGGIQYDFVNVATFVLSPV
jgi:hypothetical protein